MKSFIKNSKFYIILLIGLVVINSIAFYGFMRFDWTRNHQYTLSKPSQEIIENIAEPVYVSVFLKGNFPSHFKRLQNETRYLLEEFHARNANIKFKFYNPLEENTASAEEVGQGFFRSGMPPQRINIQKNGTQSQQLIFPWAVATRGKESVKIALLKMNPEDTEEELIQHSIQNLEYAFADGFKRLTTKKQKKIAFLRSNGELPDPYIASFLQAVGRSYHTAPFSLEGAKQAPLKTLEELQDYDLIVEAKPTKAFSEKEKFVLDQYLMNGGKALWLVEAVRAEKDSLFKSKNASLLAYPQDLNLSDFFFKYGLRILPSLVNDLRADHLILASGSGRETQFHTYPWYYSPLVPGWGAHPIVQQITPVRFDFANPMDTLKNGIHKEVLLKSSVATRVEGTPTTLNLSAVIGNKPDFDTYHSGEQILAVLLEGQFPSVYQNRVKPFAYPQAKDTSLPTKMIVISDGDVIKHEIEKGTPTSLEYNPKTGKSYGNQEFLLNAVNYLVGDTAMLSIRSKKSSLAFLDPKKVTDNRLFWQVTNIVLPLLFLLIFGFIFQRLRRRIFKKSL